MAYLNRLASVLQQRIDALRQDLREPLGASRVTFCSHLLAYWVEEQPLGKLLGEAIDGGHRLDPRLWHPLRSPVVQDAKTVASLNEQLQSEWDRVVRDKRAVVNEGWYVSEIRRVLAIFEHASKRGECIVSMLDRPADIGAARRVRLPDLTSGSWIRKWLGTQ
jgi:hypothetical protein